MARPRSHSSEGRDSHPGLKAEVSCGAGVISFPAAVARLGLGLQILHFLCVGS